MSTPSVSPFPGIQVHDTQHGIRVLRLHWSADPEKAEGEWIDVPEIKRSLSPWALKLYREATDKSLFLQEYEIDASATLGQRVFQLDEEATLEKSFPIPPTWTRYFSLDPHPSVPHAALWLAVDPFGDLWAYRELWPSKVCFRYDGGILLGKAGPCPEEDNRYRVREYVSTIRYLESDENPENEYQGIRFNEEIAEREIDYAARAFGKGTSDDPEQPNFQQRFEHQGSEIGFYLRFEDAKKDRGAGEEIVNAFLKPRDVDDGQNGWMKKSQLHIFSDRCPELIYELNNNRRQQLSAVQAEKIDPTGKPVQVRKHCTDNLLYICAANPRYIEPRRHRAVSEQIVPGISY